MTEEQIFLEKLHDILENNLDKSQFNIPELCLAIGMSRTSLHRSIYKVAGKSISIYVRHYKLTKAYEKLSTEKTSVGQVAHEVGFSDIAYFSKCFRKYFGKPPSTILQQK